jgi:hypothetical protein
LSRKLHLNAIAADGGQVQERNFRASATLFLREWAGEGKQADTFRFTTALIRRCAPHHR